MGTGPYGGSPFYETLSLNYVIFYGIAFLKEAIKILGTKEEKRNCKLWEAMLGMWITS